MKKTLLPFLMIFLTISAISYVFLNNAQLPSELKGLQKGVLSRLELFDVPITPPNVPLDGRDGDVVHLNEFTGKFMLVNIWATWCAPCLEEMPSLARLNQARGGDDFEVVIVSIDRDGFPKTDPWLERLNIHGLRDFIEPSGRLPLLVESQQMPTTLILNPEGRMIGKITASLEWDGPEAQRLVDILLSH